MEEVLDSELVDETPRQLPERVRVELPMPRSDVGVTALAAAGGIVAGAATIAVARAVGAIAGGVRRGPGRGLMRRRERPARILASRSFQVDVHLLDR